MAIIAITTSSSIRVKALRDRRRRDGRDGIGDIFKLSFLGIRAARRDCTLVSKTSITTSKFPQSLG
jgi:hypothetical protein